MLGISSQAQNISWTSKTTNTLQKTDVVSDKNGNTYLLAGFTGTVTIGKHTFTSLGATDLLLIKYNAAGGVDWVRRIGSKGEEQTGAITIHLSNSTLLVTGSFQSTATFEEYPGKSVTSLKSAGGSDIFVAQYDLKFGWLLWARRAGGALHDYGSGIAVDKAGNALVTGSFSGTIPLLNVANIHLILVSKGSSDILLLKYIPQGSLEFARALGGTGYDLGTAVAVDDYTNDIYVTGGYSPVSHPYNTNVLLAKYNYAGTLQWSRMYGAATTVDVGKDILITNENGKNRTIYLTGYFGGSISFDTQSLSSNGPADAFMVELDLDENAKTLKAIQYGGKGWDEGQSLTYGDAEVYLAGIFTGSITIWNTTLHATGGATDQDMFLCHPFSSMMPPWAMRIGSTGLDYGGDLTIHSGSTLFYTGSYSNSLTLGATTLSGKGNLLTKITLPTLTGLQLYNATTDTSIDGSLYGSTINYMIIGTDQINFRANVLSGGVGSVKFILDGKIEWMENAVEPFTYPGDGLKTGGGIDYKAFTPSVGKHKLEVIPYSGANGSGLRGRIMTKDFEISLKTEMKGLTLINAKTDLDIYPLGYQGTVLNYAQIGTSQINFRANTFPAKVGSVKFVLDGKEIVDNTYPYTLGGEGLKVVNLQTDYFPLTLSPGTHYLSVTAYSKSNGDGYASNTIPFTILVMQSTGRVSFEETDLPLQERQLSVAPNPFSQSTSLRFTPATNGSAQVEVYSSQGTLVAHLFQGAVEAGKAYQWEFNGSALPAGIYYGRVSMGGQVFHQKLVLNR